MSAADEAMDAAVPVPAATAIVVRDDPLRALMMRRPVRGNDAYSATMVFPGGAVEPSDRAADWLPLLAGHEALTAEARALRIAAIRETFEETGVLIACGGMLAPGAEGDFRGAVADAGLTLDLDRLTPIAHWITPKAAKRRFDTHFFLCAADADGVARASAEAVDVEWVDPAAASSLGTAGAAIPFPTRMNLARVAEGGSHAGVRAAALARAPFTVEPVLSRDEAGTIIGIPAEAGYGITRGRP